MSEASDYLRSLRVPIWCPLCGRIMKGKSTNTYLDHGVCVLCSIHWIEGREQRWKDGWRPSPEEVKAHLDSLASS